MRTFDRIHALELNAQGLVAYLRTAVLNRIRDEVRSATRRPVTQISTETAVDPEPNPLDRAIGRQAAARYEKALEGLPERERSAVIMRLELGLSYPEIAAALDWNSGNAARMAVTRAIDQMAAGMALGSAKTSG